MSRGEVITFASAVNEALTEAMAQDDSVVCYGLGVTDPKAVFGTTAGLESRFGRDRVFDMPTSENAMTGVAIGAALGGLRPIMTHQRLDFFLLALDQLVNAAAKWHYMFGSQQSVPITIRLIVGRGWGQGPTHSQNLHAWFAHIPGLKVVMPTTPEDAKGLLLSSIFDPNPVIFLEHRWLHGGRGVVPEGDYRIPLGEARVVRPGVDITVVSVSYLTVESLEAANFLSQIHGIELEIVDLRSIRPMDFDTVRESINRTGRLIVLDSGFPHCSLSSEIVARASMQFFGKLKAAPAKLTVPDVPEPTSHALTRNFHVGPNAIVDCALTMMGLSSEKGDFFPISRSNLHDVPGPWFSGPF